MISNICPVCEEGILSQYAGYLNYSSCDTCCSDIATPEQLSINKRNKQMNEELKFKYEDDVWICIDPRI